MRMFIVVDTWYDENNRRNESIPPITINDGGEVRQIKAPKYVVVKPKKPGTDEEWDQTEDAAKHMRYAHSLGLPSLELSPRPIIGRAVIVGGAPSLNHQLDKLKAIASDPVNKVFAINYSHTWLIEHGIVPHGTVLFEIDAEPDNILKKSHPDVTYYICSHCHPKTFDSLADRKRVLWHNFPSSDPEKETAKELFPDNPVFVGGGIGSFLRTISVALIKGYRNIDVFGCDSSFPEDAPSTHIEGYETENDVKTDKFPVWVQDTRNGEIRKFFTVSYLALQVEEFKEFCRVNHHHFGMHVHGDSLLRYNHEILCPEQYA